MRNLKSLIFHKNPGFLLALVLTVFFLKGVLLASAFPIFGGQDESRHYNSIQYLTEPKEKTWVMEKKTDEQQNKDDISTYRYSDEIKRTASATDTDVLRGDIFNTIAFSNDNIGINEKEIAKKLWQPINRFSPPDAVVGSLYHKVAASIEKAFASQDILFRFYLIRIFSVLLGTFAIFLSYLIAKNIGFSQKHSLFLAAITSFQPKFAMYFSNINYDVLLIPMFFLFTLAGVLTLKKGLDWKNLALFAISMTIAIQTKATGFVLILMFLALIAYLLYEKVKLQNKHLRYSIYISTSFLFIFISSYLYNHFFQSNGSIGEIAASIKEYVFKTITFGKFVLPSNTYWGNLNWVNNWTLNNATDIIFVIEILAVVGLGLLFFSKKSVGWRTEFLPAKKYLVFLFGIVVALQLGVRIADWNTFVRIGGIQMSLGTPGRYFLPNLVAHIILVFTGLGMFFQWFLQNTKLGKALDSRLRGNDSGKIGNDNGGEKMLDYSLLIGLILMMSLTMYLIFDVIIYRFYL